MQLQGATCGFAISVLVLSAQARQVILGNGLSQQTSLSTWLLSDKVELGQL